MKKKYPLLINTCDKYQSLWPLTLKYLNKFKYDELFSKVYLNNEKNVNPEINVEYVSLFRGNRAFPISQWSIHLKSALECIPDDYVFLSQDDYIFFNSANYTYLSSSIEKAIFNLDFDCLHLSPFVTLENSADLTPEYKKLKYGKYFLNTQFALWKKSSLISALCFETDPWSWELLGYKNLINSLKIVALFEKQCLVEYFAILKKGRILKRAEEFLTEEEYSRIAKEFGVYKTTYVDMYYSLRNSLKK